MERAFLSLSLAVAAAGCAAAQESYEADLATYRAQVVPYLKKHCLSCHGPDKQKGDFRVDEDLDPSLDRPHVAEKWHEVLNTVNAGEMPPEKEPRPPAALTATVVEWVEAELDKAEASRLGSRIVLRRLNRAEYDNTVRDLLGFEVMPPPSERFGFPEDPPASGFDNVGEALVMSPLQMELYLEAAAWLLDRAVVTGERPAAIDWHHEVEEGGTGDKKRMKFDGQNLIVNTGVNPIRNGMVVIHHNSWNKGIGWRPIEVPHEGWYTIRVRAAGTVPSHAEVVAAAKRFHESKGDGKWTTAIEAHFGLPQYRFGPPRMRVGSSFSNTAPLEWGTVDVTAPPSAPEVHTFRAYLAPGTGVNIGIANVYRIPRHLYNFWFKESETHMGKDDTFPRPTLHVEWMELEGPELDAWPPSHHTRILFDSELRATNETAYARAVLERFMTRAYRRPARAEEVDRKLAIFERVRPGHESFEAAIKLPLTAVLASPNFLYLTEPEPEVKNSDVLRRTFTAKDGRAVEGAAIGRTTTQVRMVKDGTRSWVPISAFSEADQEALRALPMYAALPKARVLNEYETANRLSYFLWSTMPDQELFDLAAAGELRRPETLAAQFDRMFRDPRAKAFVENFAGQWLGLRDIGNNPPGSEYFPRYDKHLAESIRRETQATFAEILHRDLDVRNLIQPNWLMLNERLARYYGIPGVKGDHMRRVPARPEWHRGGILTQASFLSITSNGTRTVPVNRGKFILERLLGTPLPPPPPNVEEIPQASVDTRLSMKERMAQHREDPNCARCHRKVDPLGVALENYDGAGGWRTHEIFDKYGRLNKDKDPEIDPVDVLPDGTEVNGVEGLRKEILRRQEYYFNAVAKHLAVYALGRELTRGDRAMIASAVDHMKQNGNTLRALMEYIVTSPQFLAK